MRSLDPVYDMTRSLIHDFAAFGQRFIRLKNFVQVTLAVDSSERKRLTRTEIALADAVNRVLWVLEERIAERVEMERSLLQLKDRFDKPK